MRAEKTAPLQQSFAVQTRVIGALLIRELLTRFGRDNLGILWLFLEPMILVSGVTLLWCLHQRGTQLHASGLSITAFAWIGYSTVMMWRQATMKCGKAVMPNVGLLFHRNVRVLDLFFSRIILEITGATISWLLIGIILIYFELIPLPRDLMLMILGWFLLIWYTFGLGFIVGALSERWEPFMNFYHPAMYFYLGISGAFFMVDWLPEYLQKLAVWVPTVTVTEMMRHGYYGDIRTYEQPGYLCVLSLVLTFIGLLLSRETQYRIGQE